MSTALRHFRSSITHLAVVLLVTGGFLALAGPVQAHARAGAGTLPQAAFLQPEDVGGAAVRPADDGYAVHLRPPLPGGAALFPSRASLRAEGAVVIDYPTADFHTTVVEFVATYRGGGAARYLTELRRALAPCGRTDTAGQWTIVRTGVGGRDTVLIRLRESWENPDGQPVAHTTYVAVARTGRTVVVLADVGWEYGSGDRAVVQRLIKPALHRAAGPQRSVV